jgi:hypothetical protein
MHFEWNTTSSRFSFFSVVLAGALVGCSSGSPADGASESATSEDAIVADPVDSEAIPASELRDDAPLGVESALRRTYRWYSIKTETHVAGTRKYSLRVAARLAFDDARLSYFRGYAALTCWVSNPAGTFERHACSVQDAKLYANGTAETDFETANTGPDGMFSVYTRWLPIAPGCNRDSVTLTNDGPSAPPIDVGLAGRHFHPAWLMDEFILCQFPLAEDPSVSARQ